jgi:hypothetical protein
LNWGIAAFAGALVCAAPMVVGAMFAFRPSEKLLALMRPLTIAAVFAAHFEHLPGLCQHVRLLVQAGGAGNAPARGGAAGRNHGGAVRVLRMLDGGVAVRRRGHPAPG